MLLWFLKKVVSHGHLIVIMPDGSRHEFGPFAKGPRVAIRIVGKGTDRWIAMNPDLRVGEAYMDGRLVVDEGTIRDFLEIALVSYQVLPKAMQFLQMPRVRNMLRDMKVRNRIGVAEKNVKHHYDLSGELYDLFLDKNRQYSCAYFTKPEEDIETAQVNKLQHIAAKLRVGKDHNVLDIGCGWGGMAIFLAKTYGARVTGVTLSDEQHAYANAWVKREGLEHLVTIKKLDYRLEPGVYDRIVSVGMFEHVGQPHFQEFFTHVKRLLKDDGVCLLHTIGRTDPPCHINDWVRQYIFPGAYLPSLSQLAPIVENLGMYLTDFENLRLHYAETLKAWHERFDARRDEAKALYDEQFCRMWEFYLASCEMGFRYQNLVVFHLQITKNFNVLPMTRDYMVDEERRLKAQAAGRQGFTMAAE
ncbi:MAG: class I SAM-dependent methyltransferase [Alphaproteobacteria bacterium]|nr:class I SAM-dependent methyltransferase [Alphaproteobacteria bacterium]